MLNSWIRLDFAKNSAYHFIVNNIIDRHCWLPIYLGDFCHICKQSVAILSVITTVVGTSVRTKLLVVKHSKMAIFVGV